MAIDPSSKKYLTKFGLKLRALREAKGWTLEETEDHGWPSWNHLQRIESGKKNINLTTLVRLSKLYRIHPSDLLKDI